MDIPLSHSPPLGGGIFCGGIFSRQENTKFVEMEFVEMARPKRKRIVHKRDLPVIARLYCQGKTQAEIGKQVGISQQQVSYDLKIIQKQWLKSSLVDIDTAKARELAKLDQIEREAWLAWERSQQNKEVRSVETENIVPEEKPIDPPIKGKGLMDALKLCPGAKFTMKQEGQAGDPRFLEAALKCVAKRAEIFGLDAPKKISNPDGGPVEFYLNLGMNNGTSEASTENNVQRVSYTFEVPQQ